ncbi:MAG: hypothetical protein MUF86_13130 [Akkermansiaceae bacterium]|jgi:hypothetical protein|nr:hypothetical protein [Akkermansiaceae bacterium]
MTIYLYLSLIPEALVASHLPPEEYGAYLSLGPKKRSHGQAVFFKLSDSYARERLDAYPGIAELRDGRLRRSAYLGIHRVLESTPLEAIESLHLTTGEGQVLTLLPGEYQVDPGPRYHLYQEFCPVTPRVASTLEPREFAAAITDVSKPVSLPAVAFAELILDRLGDDPEANGVDNLPYRSIEHLRDCLRELRAKQTKSTKLVVRYLEQDVLFRTILGGFYVAAQGGAFRFFPMPSRDELETTHYAWWRSALRSTGI